jgi:hypothetical protein
MVLRRHRWTGHRGLRHLNLLTFLRESTWGYPIISAIHVLGIAWFGGTVLISQFAPELRMLRRIGITVLLITGVVLFWLHPTQYSNSISFRAKMLLLILLTRTKPASANSLALWAAIIFASRGIAFG